MALQTKTGGVKAATAFADGEAECLVEALRNHVQTTADATEDGKATVATRHWAKAEAVFGKIEQRLRGRFERYASRAFPDDEGLQEDAILEMTMRLRADLMGDPSYNTFYASRFNAAVQALLIDAIRRVRVENDINRDTGEHRFHTVSLDAAPLPAAGDNTRLSLADVVHDPAQQTVVEQVLGRALGRDVLSRLPTAEHRAVFSLRVEGVAWKEIQRRTGVPVRTAQNWFDRSCETLRNVLPSYYEETDL